MDERGYCSIVGRLKDMIIRGGENTYPREIEDCLFRHDAVADVAVVSLPDDRWGEVVTAFVRPASGATPTVTGLRQWTREHLAAHKTPPTGSASMSSRSPAPARSRSSASSSSGGPATSSRSTHPTTQRGAR